VVGCSLSSWLVVLLVRFLPQGLPRTDAITLDTTVMIVPSWPRRHGTVVFVAFCRRCRLPHTGAHVIKDAGERGSTRAPRPAAALVVAETRAGRSSCSRGGILANSFLRLQRVDSGFKPEARDDRRADGAADAYPKGATRRASYRRLLEGLSERPELQAVGVGFPGPFHASSASGTFFIEGGASTTRADRPFGHLGTVSGGYFAAMASAALGGRSRIATWKTRRGRDRQREPRKEILAGREPVGKRLRFDDNPRIRGSHVVGLVGDSRQLGLSEQPPPLLYLPTNIPLPFTSVTVRSSLPQGTVTSLLRRSWRRSIPICRSATSRRCSHTWRTAWTSRAFARR